MKIQKVFGQRWAFEHYLPNEPKIILKGVPLTKIVYRGQSPYQRIEIVDTKGFGRVFFANGFIQLCTASEAVYHEMLVHPALCSHPNPERVLVVGGGDGGVLREVLKHPVKEAVLVDIDKKVVDVAKKYLRQVCRFSFEDPRSRIIIGDGQDVIKQFKNYFDCIILDLSDPDGGISSRLFQKLFFMRARAALHKGGIVSAQTGCIPEPFSKEARTQFKESFRFFEVFRAFVQGFFIGEHTFSVGSPNLNLKKISALQIQKRYAKRKLHTKHYSPSLHIASRTFSPYAIETHGPF